MSAFLSYIFMHSMFLYFFIQPKYTTDMFEYVLCHTSNEIKKNCNRFVKRTTPRTLPYVFFPEKIPNKNIGFIENHFTCSVHVPVSHINWIIFNRDPTPKRTRKDYKKSIKREMFRFAIFTISACHWQIPNFRVETKGKKFNANRPDRCYPYFKTILKNFSVAFSHPPANKNKKNVQTLNKSIEGQQNICERRGSVDYERKNIIQV